MSNPRSSKLVVLQEKAQFLFSQLQARDQELEQYEAKVDMFLVLEGKMSAKIKELEDKVVYYEEKNRELERLRRCQLTECSDHQKRLSSLEDSYEDQKTIQIQLQQELVHLRGQLIEQEAISVFKDKALKDLQSEKQVMQSEIDTFEERTKCQNNEFKCLMDKLRDLEKADFTRLNELENVKKQLEHAMAQNREYLKQLEAFEYQLASKNEAFEVLSKEKEFLSTALDESKLAYTQLIEKQQQDNQASIDLVQEKNRLEEQLQQHSTRFEQCIEWLMNRLDAIQAQHSLEIAFQSWKAIKWEKLIESYKRKVRQLSTTLPMLHSKVLELRPSIAGLKQLVYDLSPNPAFSRAILQACKQAVEERSIAYRFAESLTSCSNDKMHHFYHLQQDIQKANTALQNELSKRNEELQKQQELISKLEDSLQTIQSKANVIVARLTEKLGHAKAVLTCLVCFYTWKDVHIRRIMGKWCNGVLLGQTEETSVHLMNSLPRVDINKLHLRLLHEPTLKR